MASRSPILSISISRNSDGSDATGDLNSLSVGFGVFLAWLFVGVFGAGSIFSPSDIIPAFPSIPSELFPVVLNSFIVTFALCLLILALSNQILLKFYVGKYALALAAILATVGTYLIYATCTGETLGWVIALIAGIAMGAGASLMTVLWGTAFSRCEFTTIVLNTLVAVVISVAAYVILIHWVPTPFSGIITGILPIIGAILLWRLTPIPYYRRREIPIFHPLPINRIAFILRIGIPTIIFGFVLGALRYICIVDVLPISDITAQLVIGAAACAAIVAVVVTVIFSKGESYWNTIFRYLTPVVAIGLFCIPFLNSGTTLLANFFLIAAYICFEVLMWFLFSDISQVFRLSPIFVFGLGRGLLEIGSLVGMLLAQPIFSDQFSGIFGGAEGTAALLLAIVIAYALLPRQREIKTIVSPSTVADQNYAVQQEAVSDEEAGLVSPNRQQDAVERNSSEEDQKHEKGRFRVRCEEIADRYMLSRRETEVIFLLAKGHNASFIQDKLCISKSTAKTHINHIYRKLDIHTQQELLNMVEDRPHRNPDDNYSNLTETTESPNSIPKASDKTNTPKVIKNTNVHTNFSENHRR